MWLVVCVCVFLALAILAVFGQTAGFGFVNYDDNANVYENAMVEKGLSAQAAGWACTHAQVFNWVPLTTLSHILDCQVFGMDAGGHHLVNVLWHSANAALLFLVLRRMPTTSDASLRNGAKAVALAKQGNQLSGGGNPMILRTLAAAYAEEGNHPINSS